MRSAGEKAPEFELMDSEGKAHKLSDYQGQTIVLYFYPRDNTPGCTKEACSFRDAYADFREAGVEVIGISPDSEQSHAKFIAKHELPFVLLSDPDKTVCKAFGVWGPKKMAGREYEGVYRTTFVIGPNGVIKKVFENVKPADHSQEVLAAVRA
ncbi:MAG: thioredoxin-dependent thiol peroxidase [Chloroflexi bacterium]|nr:thioredoxin-dependent thiol peroxidase [Chloroflexota bacterium]